MESDIDILVELERPIDFFLFFELEEFLSKILQSKVDLVIKKALKPQTKEFILMLMLLVIAITGGVNLRSYFSPSV